MFKVLISSTSMVILVDSCLAVKAAGAGDDAIGSMIVMSIVDLLLFDLCDGDGEERRRMLKVLIVLRKWYMYLVEGDCVCRVS